MGIITEREHFDDPRVAMLEVVGLAGVAYLAVSLVIQPSPDDW